MTTAASLLRPAAALLLTALSLPLPANANAAIQEQLRICGADAMCLLNEGVSLHDRGLYNEAELAYLASLSRVEGVSGKEYMAATILTMIGRAQLQQGNVAGARASFLAALPTLERRSDFIIRPATLCGLASTYLESNELDKAGTVARTALMIAEADGRYTPNIAAALGVLADVARARTKYAEAEAFYKRALTLLEEKHGPRHADVGIVVGKLATIEVEQGRLQEAEALYSRALAILEASFGSEHRTLLPVLVGYAQLLSTLNRRDEAVILEQRVEVIRRHLARGASPAK